MAQTISTFYRVAQERDFARQFQFRLVQLANTNFGEDEFVYLETATLPGREITNVVTPFMGLDFNVSGTAKYPGSENYAVVFRCDQQYDLRTILEAATFNTFDDGTSTGDYNIARNSSVITMDLLDKDLSVVRQYTLYGAYVKSVGQVNYDLKDSGTVVTIEAALAYQYWRVTQANNSPTIIG